MRGRPLAVLLAEHGELGPDGPAPLAAPAANHPDRHAGEPERSLAALDLNASTWESLGRVCGPEIEATLALVAPAPLDLRALHSDYRHDARRGGRRDRPD